MAAVHFSAAIFVRRSPFAEPRRTGGLYAGGGIEQVCPAVRTTAAYKRSTFLAR
jgi:hypothetical protein